MFVVMTKTEGREWMFSTIVDIKDLPNYIVQRTNSVKDLPDEIHMWYVPTTAIPKLYEIMSHLGYS